MGSCMKMTTKKGQEKQLQLQSILDDHAGQEKIFLSKSSNIANRVTIVRPTNIKDKTAKGVVQVLGYSNTSCKDYKHFVTKTTVKYTPRADLASWIVNETCSPILLGGRIVDVTGVR